ncbi:MAG: type II toxin-antitoxin system RelE/ParE family toxin [Chloroflexota bacterium]
MKEPERRDPQEFTFVITLAMRTVNFYRLPNGASPVEEFLDSLTGKQTQKVLWVLQLIEELEVVPRQYFKKLVGNENIWEVCIQFGNDIFRLLGFFDGGTLLILTNGFAKKTQQTPLQEIDLAVRRKKEYLARRNKL